MISFICRRIIQSILLALIVSFVVFLLLRLVPGDPIHTLIEAEIESMMEGGGVIDPDVLEEMRARLIAYHGLDRPVLIQYFDWLGRMVRLDFGTSIVRGFDIVSEVRPRLAVSLYLGAISLTVTLIFGILFGTIAAVRNGTFIDNIVTSLSNFGMTVPGFLIAILLIYFFGFVLGWLPIWGFSPPWRGDTLLSIRQTILPTLTTALPGIAALSRITRSTMLDVLNADHVRTAWAKGMREKAVIFGHVLKNGLMPIVSGLGAMIAAMFGGSIIVETIFNVPGVGQLLVTAMLSLDYTVIQAVTVLMTFIIVFSNMIVDILYGWVDPRIQYS